MGWIKRNLLFVIGVLVAVLLLAGSGYYIWSESARNAAAWDGLNERYDKLKEASTQKPSPGDDRINNIQTAREQADLVRKWIQQTTNYFQPISPIPESAGGSLTDAAFANAMHRTISQLQREADNANVTLPQQYNFSFQAQSDKVRFAPPGSVGKLAVQLGEVKTISEIIFGAHVNALEGIQRDRASDDDTQGQQADYIDEQPVTTDLATLTPYRITFRGFSTETADVLAAFASSPHEFIIKAINVQPANATSSGADNYGTQQRYAPQPNAPQPTATAMPAHGGLQTVLAEQMLRVTLLVEVVKLSPGK
jgi:hypothetical protein